MLVKAPSAPKTGTFVKFGPFYLEKGLLEEDLAEDYILIPSVQQKLINLTRIILSLSDESISHFILRSNNIKWENRLY